MSKIERLNNILFCVEETKKDIRLYLKQMTEETDEKKINKQFKEDYLNITNKLLNDATELMLSNE
jgi:hypothetical protein|tara:strand:+ start:382 stop:576 length:195 start_codon:yes stop_codon:yes gene_type:complete